MSATIRVRAFQKGGVPRRRVGEVFDAPTENGKLRADYAVFCEPVEPETPKGRAPRTAVEAPRYTKVKGEYVPEIDQGVSGGGGDLI